MFLFGYGLGGFSVVCGVLGCFNGQVQKLSLFVGA